MGMRAAVSVAGLMTLLVGAGSGAALAEARTNWDRAANIREAAHRLVGIQNERGALGTYKFIGACYQTHMIADVYTKALEACIAQDYMLTQTMVLIYERLPAEKRREMGAAEPEALARGLSGRVGTALAQYKLTQAESDALRRLVETEGFPVFFKERFPKAAPKAAQ